MSALCAFVGMLPAATFVHCGAASVPALYCSSKETVL
jgi:hypothetical protein